MERSIKTGLQLGFGLMRLPKEENGVSSVEQTSIMVDRFLEAGGTYFDTAFAYGDSEDTIRQALVERYPREIYTLTSKLNAAVAENEEQAKQEIYTSLKRTGVQYFDLYLLHAIQRTTYKKYEQFHLWDYVKQLKQQGLIKHYGFSFHGDPALLEELLCVHPDVEYVQLQVNYADWENPGVNSRKCIEICQNHGKPVIVMEPVKGGILADPIDTVKEIFDRENPDMSYSSWAVRFAASAENIFVVLSGMSSVAQMEDNLSYMKDFQTLDEHEYEVIKEVQKALDADKSIACTSCHYCVTGCPMSIPIPELFTIENRKKGSPLFRTVREYNIVTEGKGKASECLQCGQCESVCPQHLPIITLLQQISELEKE